MSSGTPREHVRVARPRRSLPVIRSQFGAGRLCRAKVQALTRIAAPGTDAGLAEARALGAVSPRPGADALALVGHRTRCHT